MLLFSRLVTMQGPPGKVTAFASDMCQYVNSKIEPEVTLWQALFGYPLGTVAYSSMVESRAQLTEVFGTLMADDEYHQRVEQGQQFLSSVPSQDLLRELVHGEPGDEGPAIGSMATIITATPENGRMADVMAWGPEIAQLYEKTTGDRAAFFTDQYGTFGQVTWITLHADAAATDAAAAATSSSDEYMVEVIKGGDLFIPGSGHQSLVMRIA